MMNQFVVWGGRLFLFVPGRYDFWYGFHRLIKELP